MFFAALLEILESGFPPEFNGNLSVKRLKSSRRLSKLRIYLDNPVLFFDGVTVKTSDCTIGAEQLIFEGKGV